MARSRSPTEGDSPDRFDYPHNDLQIGYAAYLNGLGEAAGELRRYLLDAIRRGDVSRCEELLTATDDIYSVLITMDLPDSLTVGLPHHRYGARRAGASAGRPDYGSAAKGPGDEGWRALRRGWSRRICDFVIQLPRIIKLLAAPPPIWDRDYVHTKSHQHRLVRRQRLARGI